VSGRNRFEREIQRWDRIYSGAGPIGIRMWNKITRANVRQRFERTFAIAGGLDGRTVLDVGAGTGRYAERALDLGAERVVAVDPSAAMIRHLEEVRAGRADGARLELFHGDLVDLPTDTPFDVVIMNGVLDYATDPDALLAQAWGRCSGRLIATVPDRRALRAPIRRRYWRLRGLHTCYFDRREVRGLAARAGLRRFDVERLGPIFLLNASARSCE
jgi:SAM-dependent methyltransferase